MTLRNAPRVMYSSREGNGNRTPSTAYPNQGVDLESRPYGPSWLFLHHFCCAFARHDGVPVGISALDRKYLGQRTPFGTSVAELVRSDASGMLAAKCGYCGNLFAKGLCRCHSGATPNVDDFGISDGSDTRSPEDAQRDKRADAASRRKTRQGKWNGE